MDMDFEEYLSENAQKVEKSLVEILSKFELETRKVSPDLLPVIKQFIKSCQGGKRIRGVLVNLGYQLAGGKKTDQILLVSAALEILHTSILIHDDIIDESELRRGQPSLFKTIGAYQALTAGDLGFFLAFKIISESSFSNKNQALTILSKIMVDTVLGQLLDIQKQNPELIAKLKTAQYTILGPLTIGAILAGKDELTRPLKIFGENLGIAYQIKDDILDQDLEETAIIQAQTYIKKAKKVIPDITKDQKLSKLLEGMGDYLVQRTK